MIEVTCKLTTGSDVVSKVIEDLLSLTDKRILVGIPQENDSREEGKEIGNAALAYIHDKGSPLAGIPARPFMEPGIRKGQDRINSFLLAAARARLNGDENAVQTNLERAGLTAQNSIKAVINEGEGFAPLKRGTVLGRLRRREGAKNWKKEKREAVMESFHPLVDTGEMRDKITYIVEDSKEP
jgi:hypothetical protein